MPDTVHIEAPEYCQAPQTVAIQSRKSHPNSRPAKKEEAFFIISFREFLCNTL
jgi:hypothetical protein